MLDETNDTIEKTDLESSSEPAFLQNVDEQNDIIVSEILDDVSEELTNYELTAQSELIEMDLGCEEVIENETEESSEDAVITHQEESALQGYSKLKGKTIEELEEYYNSIRCENFVGVFVKTNAQGYITEVKSDFFDKNLEGYIKIDEGEGDRYIYAQSCYFEEPLCDSNGQYRYKV